MNGYYLFRHLLKVGCRLRLYSVYTLDNALTTLFYQPAYKFDKPK